MRIIRPHALTLVATGTPTYVQSIWASGVYYPKYTRVRHAVSGIYYDYRAKYSHTSAAYSPPTNPNYWTYVGAAAVATGYTYTTNVRLSNFGTWTTGEAITADSVRFDDADRRDYRATIAVSTGDNTIRPSDAVKSSTESIAARWVVNGPANAWAPFDDEVFSRLLGYDTNGALISPVTFSTACIPAAAVDCLMLVGMLNIKTIGVTVTYDGSLQETLSATLTPSTTHFGIMPSSHIFDLEDAIAAGKTITLAFTLTAYDTALPVAVGVVALGTSHVLADTEWGVESSILSFSRKSRDDTFGTVSFLPRGSATKLSATCMIKPAAVSGDTIQSLLAIYDGQAVMMDFNNAANAACGISATNYDRLRIFGFYTNVRTVVAGASFESLAMDVESLVA